MTLDRISQQLDARHGMLESLEQMHAAAIDNGEFGRARAIGARVEHCRDKINFLAVRFETVARSLDFTI